MSEPGTSRANGNQLDAVRLAAWRALLSSQAAVIAQIERELSANGLIPLGWYDVLFALSEAPDGRMRLHSLADRVLLSRSGLTRLIDRLEKAGLLCREACSTDRRGAYAVLTPEGTDALRKSWPTYARGIAIHFAHHLSDEEAQVILSVLGRVNAEAREL